jgi:hypothetical protein
MDNSARRPPCDRQRGFPPDALLAFILKKCRKGQPPRFGNAATTSLDAVRRRLSYTGRLTDLEPIHR